MPEKAISKHLNNLERQFSINNPVLQQATKVFHDLDQVEFDLGLLDQDETTARKNSWWPIISFIGNDSQAKSNFLNQFLGSPTQAANVHSASHKFTVFQYTPQLTLATLPGTALDVDHRLPFYQLSQKIEQFSKGEGSKINSYLELKTINSSRLTHRLFIETPDFTTISQNAVRGLVNQHVIELSDLVLIFTEVFESESATKEQLIASITAHQDVNKFIYIINHADVSLTPEQLQSSIAAWQRKLADLGLNTGQFLVLENTEAKQKILLDELDQRLKHLDTDRSYRVLHALEKSIRDIQDVVFPEVGEALTQWKDRCNFSTLIILGFFVTLILFAEISMGVVDLLIDPIIGPLSLLVIMAIIIPLHIIISKIHARFFIKKLRERQKTLRITENLGDMFEKSLSFWRMLLPTKEPVGNTKKVRARLKVLNERVKELVQRLNDQFSVDYPNESAPTSFINSYTREE